MVAEGINRNNFIDPYYRRKSQEENTPVAVNQYNAVKIDIYDPVTESGNKNNSYDTAPTTTDSPSYYYDYPRTNLYGNLSTESNKAKEEEPSEEDKSKAVIPTSNYIVTPQIEVPVNTPGYDQLAITQKEDVPALVSAESLPQQAAIVNQTLKVNESPVIEPESQSPEKVEITDDIQNEINPDSIVANDNYADEQPVTNVNGNLADTQLNKDINLGDLFKENNPVNAISPVQRQIAFGQMVETNPSISNNVKNIGATKNIKSTENVQVKKTDKSNDIPVINIENVTKALKSNDLEAQAVTIATIAFLSEEQPIIASQFLTKPVIDSLTGIINKDTSKLQAPTPEQIDLREQLKSGKKLSPEQEKFAKTVTPFEMAEKNKQFSIYTIATLQDVFCQEVDRVNKKSSEKLELEFKDLPAIDNIIDIAEKNPNPVLRATAIEALFAISRPEFNNEIKNVLNLVSQKDSNKSVKQLADLSLKQINQLELMQKAQNQNKKV